MENPRGLSLFEIVPRPAAENQPCKGEPAADPRLSQIVLEKVQSVQGPESSFEKRTPPMAADRIGYARLSTRDQNLDLQLDALKKAGCDRIYEDTISGTKSRRPALDQALDALRDGDTLVV
jgi:predicted site-specific integrase-resolvase